MYRHHQNQLNAFLRRKRESPQLTYISKSGNPFILEAFSDAAMAHKGEIKGRLGIIIVRRCGNVIHPLLWRAKKLQRVSRSSTTAEILAAADAVSCLMYLRHLLAEILDPPIAELTIDSKSLLHLSTTTKEPEEALNKVDIASVRENYDAGHLGVVRWSPGYLHIPDGLTKDNNVTAALLTKTLKDGLHCHHPDCVESRSPNLPVALLN